MFPRGKDDKDTVVLYFDSWPKTELCMTLPLKQVRTSPYISPIKFLIERTF